LRVTVACYDEESIMRWLPGKPWWVQAWYRVGEWYLRRWALAGSSWDTPPLEELKRSLPDQIGGWRRGEPEVIRMPEAGRELTGYTKTAQVVYEREGRRVTLWFVPLRYDTTFEEAKEDAASRTRTVHEGENYRVILWEPSRRVKAIAPLLDGVTESLGAYPRATLDEYPLPRAAPGGRLLEDEPPG
jgi:hypothetical protein